MGEKSLSIINSGIAAASSEGKSVDALIKPLVNEIHLFDTFVSGTSRLKDISVLEGIREGDRLTLLREQSKFDANDVMIRTEKGDKIGYIPEKDNEIFARLMDAGKMLTARVSGIETKRGFAQISIGIYLVDF